MTILLHLCGKLTKTFINLIKKNRSFFGGVGGGARQVGHGVDHPPPSSTEVKERVELYLYSPSGLSWPAVE